MTKSSVITFIANMKTQFYKQKPMDFIGFSI